MFELDREWTALLLVWLAFMSVTGVYVIRIALTLHEQRAVERRYRLHLALRTGLARRAAGQVPASERAEPLGR